MSEGRHWSLDYGDEILMVMGALAVFGLAYTSIGIMPSLALSVVGALLIVVIRYFAPVEPTYGPHH